jgi:uncharacterized membrane protein YdbT with pleckstrin-like domain
MKLSAPKQLTFIISIAIAVLGFLASAGMSFLPVSAFALLAIAYIILALSLLIKGL